MCVHSAALVGLVSRACLFAHIEFATSDEMMAMMLAAMVWLHACVCVCERVCVCASASQRPHRRRPSTAAATLLMDTVGTIQRGVVSRALAQNAHTFMRTRCEMRAQNKVHGNCAEPTRSVGGCTVGWLLLLRLRCARLLVVNVGYYLN